MRNFLHEVAEAFSILKVLSFMALGKAIAPIAVRTSVRIGCRPQTIAYVLLALSFLLDVFGQATYGEGINGIYVFNVVVHVGVITFGIECARRFVQRLEDTGEPSITTAFVHAFELSQLWTLLGFLSLLISAIAIGWEPSEPFSHFQFVENVLDLLSIGFGWTLMTKPPSLWERLKDRAKDWKPTFAPMPQGA